MLNIGSLKSSFLYKGDELIYPDPIKDGLILWYDFASMKNDSVNKAIASDLSGNGNNGTLQNFAYTSDSGYDDGLKFDNIDDNIVTNVNIESNSFTLSMTIDIKDQKDINFLFGGNISAFYMRKNYNDLHASIFTDKQVTSSSGNKFFYELFNKGKTKCQVILKVDDDDKTLSILGNGILIDEKVFEGIMNKWRMTSLGTWPSASNNSNLDGKLLSAHLYNRALSLEEIQHNYQLEKERWGL